MLEVDFLRICDQAFKQQSLINDYQLKVSSSELLDAICEECNIDLADRVHILSLLEKNQSPDLAKKVRVQINQEFQKFGLKGVHMNKLQELMKLKGCCAQIEKDLKRIQGI